MAFTDSDNEYRHGDLDNTILRKILRRLLSIAGLVENLTPTVVLEPGDIEIGAVEIKDGTTDTRTKVATSAPGAADPGIVVRNIPSGTQPVSGSVSVSNFPATEIVDPVYDAARTGFIAGKAAETFHVLGRRSGFNSTSVLQDVGEFLGTSIDALPELTGAENLEVVSSSASDATGQVGVRTIRIGYIDTSNNLVVSPDIAMNGTTPVALAFKANFILWMETTTSGTSPVAVGTILLRIAGAGATQEQITAGGNRSLSCRFMVPTGYTGYLVDWGVWAIATSQDVRLRATVRTRSRTLGTNYIFQSVAYVAAGSSSHEEMHYAVCPALSKIKVSTIAGAAPAGNRIDAEFTILLIAN